HGARLNCSKQFAVFQAMVTDGCTGFAQGDDLGVSRGIGAGDVQVPSPAHDASLANNHRADRHFSRLESTLGTAQGLFHPEFVEAGRGWPTQARFWLEWGGVRS